ncbi:MAG: S26 family signal peptidase [Gammaproteobacteria bacterium]|nr:S26 family signal peptidase [Gammaproteobacteria bacterium]
MFNRRRVNFQLQRWVNLTLQVTTCPRGDYPNINGYWLIGTHAKNSWDSRYWGAIKKENILYVLEPLFTFS